MNYPASRVTQNSRQNRQQQPTNFATTLQSSRFPSARHFYATRWATSREADQTVSTSGQSPTFLSQDTLLTNNTKKQRISNIQEQLIQLRRQLESELLQSGDKIKGSESTNELLESTQIGSPCLQSSDCSKSIKNSHCNLNNFTCVCLDQHVPINVTTCLARKCRLF